MKKILFSIMAWLACAGVALAQNSLSVADITLPQNSEATLTVNFKFDKADTYTGYSFNLDLPEDLSFVMSEGTDVVYTAGDCHDKSHSVTANLSDGMVKVAALSLSSKPLSGTEGMLLSFTIKPSTTLPVGTTLTGTIRDIIIVPVEGVKQKLDAQTFSIVIGNPTDTRIVLDETSATEPAAASGIDVRVKRTIKAGEWSTICLPFAMTEAQVKKAFGDDVELGDFNDYEMDADYNIKVHFVDVTAIEANHPYIIKVGSDIAEFTADGVNIDPQEAVVDFDTSRRKNQPRQMVGVYEAGTVLGWGTLFLSGNLFWYSVGATSIKAYRAYFNFFDILPDFEDKYEARSISMKFDDGVTTRLTNATQRIADGDAIYDLQGRRVINPGKGIYVSKGKKINMLKH